MTKLIFLLAAALVTACGQKPAPQAGRELSSNVPQTMAAARSQNGAVKQEAPLVGLPAGAIALQRVAVNDLGAVHPGPALYGLIPAGWSTRGGVIGPDGPCQEIIRADWAATSPDGRSSVSLFPTEVWQASNSQIPSDCKQASFETVRDYLAARVGALHPGARVLDYRPRPEFTEAAREAAAIRERMFRGAGFGGNRVYADGGEILFAFNERGAEMRGVMAAVAIFTEQTAPNQMKGDQFDPLRGQDFRTITGGTAGTFAATAPDGALDFTMIEAVRKSFTPDPAWLQRFFALKNAIGGIQTQGVAERSAIIVAGGAAATKSNIAAFQSMTNASIANSNASIDATRPSDGGAFPGDLTGDRMQRESIEAVRGVETYHDPVGGMNVQLDATYDHAWRINNQDTYILTKDPNFNPGQYGLEATQMGVVK